MTVETSDLRAELTLRQELATKFIQSMLQVEPVSDNMVRLAHFLADAVLATPTAACHQPPCVEPNRQGEK